MPVPHIRSTQPTPVYVPDRGNGPNAGDLIIMRLPGEVTPAGWTRHGDHVTRFATGQEHTFPAPAMWFSPDELDARLRSEAR